ncbi:MAG: YHYH protein [Pseudomonadota bacterium]
MQHHSEYQASYDHSALKRTVIRIAGIVAIAFSIHACSGGSSSDSGDDMIADDTDPATLNDAYLWFGANVTVALDGNDVVIEATGRPDHTSAYWNPDNSSGLYVEPDPNITNVARMSPGFIEEYNNLFTLRVDANPTLANNSSATGLGPVGIAVSGAPIFNDQEGPNIDLNIGVIQGFDRNGAHTGPSTYHYHLEPKAITDDDDSLIGVIADGFFLFGRRCFSMPGTYPDDLDISGGHESVTQFSGGETEYHYHIKDETYLGAYYLLFPEDYQGSPSAIGN